MPSTNNQGMYDNRTAGSVHISQCTRLSPIRKAIPITSVSGSGLRLVLCWSVRSHATYTRVSRTVFPTAALLIGDRNYNRELRFRLLPCTATVQKHTMFQLLCHNATLMNGFQRTGGFRSETVVRRTVRPAFGSLRDPTHG